MKLIIEIEYNFCSFTRILKLLKKHFKVKIIDMKIEKSHLKFKKTYSIEEIKNIISESEGLKGNEIDNITRKRDIVESRQIAMFYARKLTVKSLQQIGKEFGNKDHATVLHACKVVENLCNVNKNFKIKFDKIEKLL
jgi:chromosomal replication initiator protein